MRTSHSVISVAVSGQNLMTASEQDPNDANT